MNIMNALTCGLGRSLCAFLVACAAFGASPVATQPVTDGDEVQFQQTSAGEQFRELEERMFRLAELIRESEPSDSARLLMGVQRAREELIIEQMKNVVALIGERDLTRAVNEQKDVIIKLEELKKLLTTGDLDLALQLERLKKLNAAIEKLDAVIKEEQRQLDESKKIAEQQAKKQPIDAKQFDKAKQDQEGNRQQTDAVARMVKELGEGPAKSAQTLGGASGSMSGAEGSFGSQNAPQAQDQQQQAARALAKARQELERERERLVQEIQRQVKKQVIDNLTRMLETQVAVREATAALSPRLIAGERNVELRIRQLGATEQKIADMAEATVELVEQTGFSIALPPALKNIQRRVTYVAVDLRNGRGGEPVVNEQKAIERDIAALIDTFREMPTSASQGGQCKGCKSNKNKLLAELRVLRMLQTRVNEETKDLDGRRARAMAEMEEELKKAIGTTARHQADVRDATEKLHRSMCPDCLRE